MHVARQLSQSKLNIEMAGNEQSVDDLLRDFTKLDRFGIVVNQSLGSLGASLLIQAAIVQFYRVAPERAELIPQYPEVYLFHVGGRYGDHSNFDFWPPRKEVFLPAGDPITLLEALNDRGITRLALPDGDAGDHAVFEDGPSTWAEQMAAQGRLVSSFAYDSSGETAGADIVLRSTHRTFEDNATATLNPLGAIQGFYDLPADKFEAALPGPSLVLDADRWKTVVLARMEEVPDQVRKEIARNRRQDIDRVSSRVESYRSLDVNAALGLIAGY